MPATRTSRSARNTAALSLATLIGCLPLTGCLVAGYSSGGGFFLWPGSLGLLVLILIVIFIARRR